jgi:hypothetical protein
MRRLKKILQWTGIVAGGLIAILLIVNAVFVWTTGARLEKRLAALREAGDPITLADLAREPIPPEKNAATYLQRAESDVAAIERQMAPINEAMQKDYSEEERESGLLRPAEQKKYQEVLAAYPKVFPLLQQAAACPEYDPQLDYTVPVQQFMEPYMTHVQKTRSVARVLQYRAMLLALQGDRDEALRTIISLYQLTRQFEREPMLVGHLVVVAIRGIATHNANNILQSGPVSKEVRAALEAELARHDGTDGYVWAIKTDRAFGLDMFHTFPWGRFWVDRGLANDAQSYYLDVMDRELGAINVPYAQARSVQPPTAKVLGTGYRVVADLVVPAAQACRAATERSRAMTRALRVLNALQARVPPGSNQVPKITELGLPPDAITDPYNGDLLKIKRVPEGWVIYAVGDNLKDDGGEKLDGLTDAGIGPARKR